ncbi:MAG: hypothetical protein MI864_15580 [Pseudomonadales bacterium]|nr:hypothetical protein [Pseudomonadales bacterium]
MTKGLLLSRIGRRGVIGCILMMGVLLVQSVSAETPSQVVPLIDSGSEGKRYVARIELHTPEEIEALFGKASQLIEDGEHYSGGEPIAFILHGPEIGIFAKSNFQKYRSLVRQAAELDAFNVIDLKVCEYYLQKLNISPADLPPFVETVPFGPTEEKRLLNQGYVHF